MDALDTQSAVVPISVAVQKQHAQVVGIITIAHQTDARHALFKSDIRGAFFVSSSDTVDRQLTPLGGKFGGIDRNFPIPPEMCPQMPLTELECKKAVCPIDRPYVYRQFIDATRRPANTRGN